MNLRNSSQPFEVNDSSIIHAGTVNQQMKFCSIYNFWYGFILFIRLFDSMFFFIFDGFIILKPTEFICIFVSSTILIYHFNAPFHMQSKILIYLECVTSTLIQVHQIQKWWEIWKPKFVCDAFAVAYIVRFIQITKLDGTDMNLLFFAQIEKKSEERQKHSMSDGMKGMCHCDTNSKFMMRRTL